MSTASPNNSAPVSDHDIFRDPALNRTMTEDPLFRFLRKYWKPLLTAIAAGFAAWFIYQRFSETAALRQGEASDLFSRSAARLSALLDTERAIAQKQAAKPDASAAPAAEGGESPLAVWEKELSELEKRRTEQQAQVKEALAALADAPSPYAELKEMYEGFAQRLEGRAEEAARTLTTAGFAAQGVDTSAQLAVAFREFQELAAARALLDSPDKMADARSQIKRLAENSQYVQASAAYAFVRTAATDAERAEAQALLDSLSSNNPEIADIVTRALEE